MSQPFEFRFQRGTDARWAELNPVLGPGEPGIEITDVVRLKVGDGHTAWNDLEYFLTESAVAGIVEVLIAETGGLDEDPRVGEFLSDLTTEDKSTIIAAINELNGDGISLELLYDNAKAG